MPSLPHIWPVACSESEKRWISSPPFLTSSAPSTTCNSAPVVFRSHLLRSSSTIRSSTCVHSISDCPPCTQSAEDIVKFLGSGNRELNVPERQQRSCSVPICRCLLWFLCREKSQSECRRVENRRARVFVHPALPFGRSARCEFRETLRDGLSNLILVGRPKLGKHSSHVRA